MIKVSAFRMVSPPVQGLVRDLRVRWALEEAGLAYQTVLVDQSESKSDAYRQFQPFGQIPYYQEDELVLFESGAIVLHIAEKAEQLLPRDSTARLLVTQWLFAALNSVEPPVQHLAQIDLFFSDTAWAKERRPEAERVVLMRLAVLESRLADRDYLEGSFSAADILMTSVLRFLRHTDLIARFPAIDGYVQRCQARPAFQRALAAQIEDHLREPVPA